VFKSTNGGGNWSEVNTGLYNLRVCTLAINPANPTTIYAGTEGGVFRSTKGGGNWSRLLLGHIYSLAIDRRRRPLSMLTQVAECSEHEQRRELDRGEYRPDQ